MRLRRSLHPRAVEPRARSSWPKNRLEPVVTGENADYLFIAHAEALLAEEIGRP